MCRPVLVIVVEGGSYDCGCNQGSGGGVGV